MYAWAEPAGSFALIQPTYFSMMATGHFASNVVDLFEGPAWDEVRRRSQEKALEMRKQGFFGAAMAGVTEIAYTGLIDTHNALEAEFRIREDFDSHAHGNGNLSVGAKAEVAAVGGH